MPDTPDISKIEIAKPPIGRESIFKRIQPADLGFQRIGPHLFGLQTKEKRIPMDLNGERGVFDIYLPPGPIKLEPHHEEARAQVIDKADNPVQIAERQFSLIPMAQGREITLSLGQDKFDSERNITIVNSGGRFLAKSAHQAEIVVNTNRPVQVGSSKQDVLRGSTDNPFIELPNSFRDKNVSGKHCTLILTEIDGQQYLLVEDLSRLGTWVRTKDTISPAQTRIKMIDTIPTFGDSDTSDTALEDIEPVRFTYTFPSYGSGEISPFEDWNINSPKELKRADLLLNAPTLPSIIIPLDRETRIPKFNAGQESRASGNHPTSNEDVACIDFSTKTALVCDGVGGSTNGARASRIARDTLMQSLKELPSTATAQQTESQFRKAFQDANAAINNKVPDGTTTAVLTRIVEQQSGKKLLVWGNSGDSRIVIIRNGTLIPVSTDHSLQRAHLENGTITPELYKKISKDLNSITDPSTLDSTSAWYFSKRNRIFGGLGQNQHTEKLSIDTGVIELQEGDQVLLTSDGIHDTLTTAQILNLLSRSEDPQEQARILVEEVERITKDPANLWKNSSSRVRGKVDDMTAVVFSV